MSISNQNSNNNNNDYDFKLKYNDRISRILLVIGTFSVIAVLFRRLWIILEKVFNIIYVNSKIPIGAEHIWIPMLLSDITLIFVACVLYCFSELYNFTNYRKNEQKIKYQINADQHFKKLLGILIICVILTVITLIITITIFGVQDNLQRIYMILGIAIFFIISILAERKKVIEKLNEFTLNFKLDKWSIILNVAIWIILGALFFAGGSLLVGDTQKSYAFFKFDTENALNLNIQFENKIPKEIIVQSDTVKGDSIKINEKDFYMSYVEVTKENYNKTTDLTPITNQFIYKQSFYEYRYKINIDKLIKPGKNTIIITFKTNVETDTKKSFKVLNQINETNGKYEIFKQDFNVSLD